MLIWLVGWFAARSSIVRIVEHERPGAPGKMGSSFLSLTWAIMTHHPKSMHLTPYVQTEFTISQSRSIIRGLSRL